MPHAEIRNRTPFAVTPLFLADADMRPLVVPMVTATYAIAVDGRLTLHGEQQPLDPAGAFWGDPATSSLKYEPASAYLKPATDVVMIGHAHAPHAGATEVQVGLRVGPVQKVVQVWGERVLSHGWSGWSMSPPAPFETLPLRYERAFGGWDRTSEDPAEHRCEARNPVGRGFRVSSAGGDDIPLPNIEDPAERFTALGDTPPPAGFGFVSPGWAPRTQWAGTYDKAWSDTRKPLLPRDFDLRFFNAASPGLVAPGHLRGDEPVVVVNASREGRVVFDLPGVPPPVCEARFAGRRQGVIETHLDTVLIDMDARLLHLVWRGHAVLRQGPHDLVALTVHTPGAVARPTLQAV